MNKVAKIQEAEALYFKLLPAVEAHIASMNAKELKAFAISATVMRKMYTEPTKKNITAALKVRLLSMCYERVGYPVPFKQQYGTLAQF